jgi:hypothetical protein
MNLFTPVKTVNLTLVGLDGNAFSLMGAFQGQAKKEGWAQEEIKLVLDKCKEGNYDDLLCTLMDHCIEDDIDDDAIYLDFCPTHYQMTNHRDGHCLKCQ